MSFKSLISRLLKTGRDQVFKLDDIALRQGITLADQVVETFENKIENIIGFPLPIEFSIDQLFGEKLVTLSNKTQKKITDRIAAKAGEIQERRTERLAEENSRSARHESEVQRIREDYANRLKEIDDLSSRVTFSTVIEFSPPPEIVFIPIPTIQETKEVERDIKPYKKEFRGDLENAILNGDYRELIEQGADTSDIDVLTNSRVEVSQNPDIKFIYAENRIKIKVKTNKKGKEASITPERERELRRTARLIYEADLEEENRIWEEEKQQYREEDGKRVPLTPEEKQARRQAREDARKASRKARQEARQARRQQREDERLTPAEKQLLRANRRQAREDERNARRDERKEEREDRREERKDNQKAREDARRLRRNTNKEERKNKRQLLDDIKKENERRINAAKEIRDLEEAEFDREIDDIEKLLDQQVESGVITKSEARQLLNEIKSEQRIEITDARKGIREVKQQIRSERRDRRRSGREEKPDRAGRNKGGRFDTSQLTNPTLARNIYLQSYQFLPQEDKDKLADAVLEVEKQLQTTLTVISSIRAAINGVRIVLNTLNKTGSTLQAVSDGITLATDLITALPVPVSTPPGVGLPARILTTLSKTLDDLRPEVEKTNDAGIIIEQSSRGINNKIDDILEKLDPLVDVITIVVDIITFLLYIARSGESSLDEIRNGLSENLQNTLNQSGNSSNAGTNVEEEDDLLDRLSPNSNDPLFYKEFRLTLQYRIGEGELTQTRVLGVNETNGVSLATDLSYTNTPEVLVQEIKFQIDNYNLIFVNNPSINIEDQLPTIDLENITPIIPSVDVEGIEDIDIPGLPARFTKKQIRQIKGKDRRSDRKERRELRKSGDLTRREARKDRKQDRRERKEIAKRRKKTRIRKRER